MKKYAILYFQQIKDKYSKWVFPLHNGENIIGSDKDVDIFLYLNDKEDKIDSVHCKIIVNEEQNNVGIISLTSNGYVKREEDEEKIVLSPVKEYELNNKTVFYLTDNIKFMLIKGTIDEIHSFLLEENLEYEFPKWKEYISAHENNMKVNFNLTKKESHNKSFISNKSYDDYNNINPNTPLNNNNLLNSEISNKTLNNNLPNSILGSNSKEINRVGFNNFDEVPDDNLINDYKILQKNPTYSTYNKSIMNIKNPFINISPVKKIEKEISQKNESNNIININNINNNIKDNINNNIINNNYKIKQLSTDITNNNNIINEKETELNTIKSENALNTNKYNNEENKDYNGIKNFNKSNDDNNNSLDLFKQKSSEIYNNNNYIEKVVNKDEETIKTIKELLGENNLDIIFKNTNYKDIKKYDIIFKKWKKNIIKNTNEGSGNIDIKFKRDDFLRNNIKYKHKMNIKND